MPLGEEPITSFFRRVTSADKRKENTVPVRSVAKRKQPAVEAEANQQPSSRKPKKQQRLVLHDALQNSKNGTAVESRRPRRTDSYASIPRGSSTTPPPVEDLFRRGIPHVRSTDAAHPIRPKLPPSTGGEQAGRLSILNSRRVVGNDARTNRALQLPTPITERRSEKLAPNNLLRTPPPTNHQKQKRPNCLSKNAISSLPTPATVGRRASSRLSPQMRRTNLFAMIPSSSLVRGNASESSNPSHIASGSPTEKPRQIPAPQFLLKETSKPHDVGNRVVQELRIAERPPSEDPFAAGSLSKALVPSSQTQDIDFEYPDFSTGSPHASPSFRFPFLPDHIVSRNIREPCTPLSATIPDNINDCQYVHSSQSQHMLPYHISPVRNRVSETFRSSSLSLNGFRGQYADEIIQSSQSQTERELDISEELLDHHPRMMDNTITVVTRVDDKVADKVSLTRSKHPEAASHLKPNTSSLQRSLPRTTPVARTLSDELFPSSILHLNFDDVYPEEVSQNGPCAIELPSVHQDLDESATEDESGDEFEDAFRNALKNVITPKPQTRYRMAHISVPSSHAVDTDEEDLNDAHKLVESLPNAVKDFRDMFGDGDGSYPDDFPMSLR